MDKQNFTVSLIHEDINKKVKVKPLNYKSNNVSQSPSPKKKIKCNPKLNEEYKKYSAKFTPIIFFINPKSGSKEGEDILKLIPDEVIDLNT